MDSMLDRFLSIPNFTLAYQRLKTATRSPYKEFYYDDFRYFETFFDEYIAELLHELKEEIYSPSACERYYMPKKKNLARPITMLNLLDQIVYQAIANVCADELHPHLSKYFNNNTFGNIFVLSSAKNSIFFYEKWKLQWKKFNQKKKKAYADGYEYCADFDIASFYDTIDHGILISILNEYSIDKNIIELLSSCLSRWTTASTSKFQFQKTSRIPQGPISSAFFAELYLFKLDEIMRRYDKIRYFRYADDISIMAQSEQDCQKMIVYLDLLARDLSLIPQAEKIDVFRIYNIEEHIKTSSIKFSQIAKEYQNKNRCLNEKTHENLKKRFIQCFKNDSKFDKSVIKFALFKLNDDDEIKNILVNNISKLELFYDGVVFYFNRHFRGRSDFDSYIIDYLLRDTVLFQYNKSLLFRGYSHLLYNEEIFRSNFRESTPFWIVQYHLVSWLHRCEKDDLAEEAYKGDNYYINRQINKFKVARLSIEASGLLVDNLVSAQNPLVSMQGLYMKQFMLSRQSPNDSLECNNGYSERVLKGDAADYISYIFKNLYELEIPQKLLRLLQTDADIYRESKEALKEFKNNITLDPSKSIMNLNLFNNILFDVLAKEHRWTGEFGKNTNQMEQNYPLAHAAFTEINSARNQKTFAHYKDKNGLPRTRIKKADYDDLLRSVNLAEVYNEVFAPFR